MLQSMTPRQVEPGAAPGAPVDRDRRAEILQTAATLIASSGMRTSLKEIADACGILPGSLYHHFESKEAILVELIEEYRADLDGVAAEAHDRLVASPDGSIAEQIVALANEMAACAMRHRAALLLTFYEPPTVAGDELVQIAQRTPMAIEHTAIELFGAAQASGYLRAGIDLDSLADRFCQVMLHISLGVLRDVPGAEQVPEMRCRILLDGIAVRPPKGQQLDRSKAMKAAQQVVASWDGGDESEDERFALLRSVARNEFGRKGYEATTVRDIAAAAGLSTGSVYRLVGSKDELLATIMQSFGTRVQAAWKAVLTTDSSPLEKLDALMWLNINVVDQFNDEFSIQVAWLRESPPSTSNLGWSFTSRLRDVKSLLAEGIRTGELQLTGPTADLRAWSLFELLWMPEEIVRKQQPRGALALARDTVLRGAATRR
jgi:AcrR family transcriptional regulator